VVKTTITIGLWNNFHKKLMIASIAEFSHSNQTTAFSPHVQTAIYDSKVKLFLKQGISCQLGRG
jgi:hypothetical protein